MNINNNQVLSSTVLILATIASLIVASGNLADEFLRFPAIAIGVAIVLAALLESVGNVRSLVRADWLAILALYGLTLTEFLFEQPDFNERMTVEESERALWLFSLGFTSLVAGRHLFWGQNQSSFHISRLSPRLILLAFWIVVPLGFAAELIAVKFNVLEMIDAQMGPRFSQPWSRGKVGGIYSLLFELGLFKYGIPAIAGVLFNYRDKIGNVSFILVMAACMLTLFFAFCTGTRNLFAAYLAGFLATYLLTLPRLTFTRIATVSGVSAFVFFWASFYMLEFRNMGFKNFLQNRANIQTSDTYFVDYNMWAIGKIGNLFPEPHQHLGWELYWHAITKPIPRVIWSGKPVELSTSIEGALGAEGLTISTTFIGESYMAFGEPGIIATGLFLGFICSWWNSVGGRMSDGYGQLIYASGFAAIAIAMRSLMFFTTNMLPTIGLIAVAWFLKKIR